MTLLSTCCWIHCWPWIFAAAWLGASVACLAVSLVHYGRATRAADSALEAERAELEATRVALRGELEEARRKSDAGEYPWGRPPHP